MVFPSESPSGPEHFDAVIFGGAFTGSALATLLLRRRPKSRVLILEKSTVFDRKVGESTSEVAGCFLTRVLGLGHYLAGEHYQKHGLRLWFNRNGNDCPSCCSELGPYAQARFPTYQLDRAKLDQHLLETAVAEGCELIRPATIKSFELGGKGHNSVTFKHAGETRTITADWVADCSGRAALIGRHRKTIEPLPDHPVHSMWVRFAGVRCLDSEEARRLAEGLRVGPVVGRSSSTNHLMGRGWWSWIIPLSNGDFSAGVTWDERLFTPPAQGAVGERVKQHLLSHPIGKLMFENAVAVENDARIFKNLPYQNTEVCGDGWICAGDAAGFMDPLYSQGLDYCGHGAYTAHGIIADSLDGQCVADRTAFHRKQYLESYHRWFNALYRNKYQYLGDSDLMHAAFLLDLATYFVGPVQLVYRKTDHEFSRMPYEGPIGGIFARFMAFYNRRLETIARKRIQAGSYGKNNLGHRRLIKIQFEGSPRAFRHLFRGLLIWWRLELQTALSRPAPPMRVPSARQAPVPDRDSPEGAVPKAALSQQA